MKKYQCATEFIDDLSLECDKLLSQMWNADEKTLRHTMTHFTELAIKSLIKKHNGVTVYDEVKVGDSNEEEQER